MTGTPAACWPARLIATPDAHVRSVVERYGGHYDPVLGGCVFEPVGGLPVGLGMAIQIHGLKISDVDLAYNPCAHGPKSPPPVWEDVEGPWDGGPVPSDEVCIAYFLHPALNGGHPFQAVWMDGCWRSGAVPGPHTAAEALAAGWRFLATAREVLEVTYVRIDRANEMATSPAHLETLHAAITDESSSLQVAAQTGRIALGVCAPAP